MEAAEAAGASILSVECFSGSVLTLLATFVNKQLLQGFEKHTLDLATAQTWHKQFAMLQYHQEVPFRAAKWLSLLLLFRLHVIPD